MADLSSVHCTLDFASKEPIPDLVVADMRVLRAQIAQRLDRPWSAAVTLVSNVVDLDVQSMVGRSATLLWGREDSDWGPHSVSGVITHAEYLGTFGRELHARVTIEPAAALLRYSRRRRIYEGKTAAAIARELVESIFDDDLGDHHETLDYRVQYDESDLEFLQRILAEAGIAYIFDSASAEDRLVLVDSPEQFPPVGVDRVEPPEIPMISRAADLASTESVQSLSRGHGAGTASWTEAAWDFKQHPPRRLAATSSSELIAGFGEHLRHYFGRVVELEHGDGPHDDPTGSRAEHAAKREAVESVVMQGRGKVVHFIPGSTFSVYDHPNADLNDHPYLLTRVVHHIEIPTAALGGQGREPEYYNEFSCIPADIPYRPAIVAPPRVPGPETAMVVGPEGEEIHTDVHGRVRVRFHWDEHAEGLENTCWLRVGQAWAGAGFGTLFLPRVGMEVVVSFLGGDPSRPFVTGCLYNAANIPPVNLPEDRTQSTIRTSSSPGNEGYNELRFEDAAGKQEVYLRAQRNLRESVGADHSTKVGGDQTLSIKGNSDTKIEGGESIMVEGKRNIQVDEYHYTFVTQSFVVDVPGPSPKKIAPHAKKEKAIGFRTDYDAEILTKTSLDLVCEKLCGPTNRIAMVPDETKIICGESRITMSPTGIEIKAEKSITLTVDGTSLSLTPEDLVLISKSINLNVGDGPVCRVAETRLQLDGAGVRVVSPAEVCLEGGGARVALNKCDNDDVAIEGESASLSGKERAKLEAPTVEVNGASKVRIEGGGGVVKLVNKLVELNSE